MTSNALMPGGVASSARRLRASGLALLGLVAVGTTACASASAQEQPTEEEIGLLFAPTAEAGSLQPVKGTSRLELTLTGVDPQVVWFSDRPARESGHIPIEEFVASWKGYGFVEDPPNAALSVLGADDSQDTVVLELGSPELDDQEIRFPVEVLDEATGGLSHLGSDLDEGVEASFGPATLFIDDATAMVASDCVLQSHGRCRNADLTGMDLTGFDLSYADLSRTVLERVNFRGANLGATGFAYADLQQANFDSAYVNQANFRWANLTGATNLSWRNGLDEGTLFCQTVMPDGSQRDDNC